MAPTSLQQHDPHQQPRSGNEIIIGVDTHKDIHVAAILSPTGALLATSSFATTLAGCEKLLEWVRSHGEPAVAGVEGTGSWGAGLTQALRREGIAVIEVNRPDRSMRRRHGKTDAVDAEAAGRAVLSGHATVTPKSHDGMVEAMRLYKLAKDSAVKARTQAINQLKGVLVNGDPSCEKSWPARQPTHRSRTASRSTTTTLTPCGQPGTARYGCWPNASVTFPRRSASLRNC